MKEKIMLKKGHLTMDTASNHAKVKRASTSVSNNNSSGYSKSNSHQSVSEVTLGTKNVDALCKMVANKNRNYLNKGV